MIKQTMLILAMTCMAGCTPKNAFAPPPDAWEVWVGPHADEVQIWKDMLDCNHPEPFGAGHRIEGGTRGVDEKAS